MVAGNVSMEVPINVPVERVWKGIKDSNNMFPKALPDAFQSIETIEGDGKVGSIRQVNFGPAVPHKYAKEKLDSVVEDNHTIVVITVEGGHIGTLFSSQKTTLTLKPAEEKKTLVFWSLDYDTIVDDPPLDRIKANAEKFIKGVEAYLISNNEYA